MSSGIESVAKASALFIDKIRQATNGKLVVQVIAMNAEDPAKAMMVGDATTAQLRDALAGIDKADKTGTVNTDGEVTVDGER